MSDSRVQQFVPFKKVLGTVSMKSPGDVLVAKCFVASLPGHYERDQKWQAAGTTGADRYILQTPNQLTINVNDAGYVISAQADLDLSLEATWDQVVTDYRVAATRAGLDFYIYACQPTPTTDTAPTIIVSANSTYPDGYTADNSRKVSGFHCLSVAVGTIGSHTLTDYVAGDILPASIWDIIHRPYSSPEGMVYDAGINKWVDIYLASGTGASTTSVNGGTISDNRNWMDFVDDGIAVKKRLLSDIEFQSAAAGSNEETNILGSGDPGNTGGHSDTASRRMISDIGMEDCCGAMYQWLNEQSMRIEGNHTHTQTITHKAGATGSALFKDQAETKPNAVLGSAADETIISNATDIAAWGWYDLPGSKGSLYKQGTYGDVKLRAGGSWNHGAACGSRGRNANNSRWYTHTSIGARFLSESQKY